MQMTPTDKGSLIAGLALSTIGWASILHLDTAAKICRIDRWVKQEKLLDWIIRNRTFSLLVTEVINFSVHGITGAADVLFAVGSTIVNAFVILIFLPLRQKAKREKGVSIA